MANTEGVARQLFQLDRAVEQHAGSIRWPGPVGQPRSTKHPKEQIYERCVDQLDPEERLALDGIIEKMMRAARLPSPPAP